MLEQQFFNSLPAGNHNIPALLKEVQEKVSKNGPYLVLTLLDGKSEVSANYWNMSLQSIEAAQGDIVEVQLEKGRFKERDSYTVKGLKAAGQKYSLSDFIKTAPANPENMYEYLLSVANDLQYGLNQVTSALLVEHKEILLKATAAKSVHHNYISGLLWHTYRMTRAAQAMCQVYKSLDKSILICGTMLHDIGKVKELTSDVLGNTSYTVDGTLFGHALIGIQMIDQCASSYQVNEEALKMVKHIIASHHGKLEWGAITQPATAEAAMVHQLDMTDSRVEQYESEYWVLEAGTVSERKFGLEGACIYRMDIESNR